MRRNRRTFTPEFKQQMVNLYHSGKPRKDIAKEYALTHSALDRWIQQSNTTGSFKHKDNLSPEEKKIIEQEKELNFYLDNGQGASRKKSRFQTGYIGYQSIRQPSIKGYSSAYIPIN